MEIIDENDILRLKMKKNVFEVQQIEKTIFRLIHKSHKKQKHINNLKDQIDSFINPANYP